jgi:hypothetical protein
VVLINPAAEAAKWTAIQREVWYRTAVTTDAVTPIEEVDQGHKLFPSDQTPVVVSAAAAPPILSERLTEADSQWIENPGSHYSDMATQIRQERAKGNALWRRDVEYDGATRDLFPAFKFDFRPVADRWERIAENQTTPPSGADCRPGDHPRTPPIKYVAKRALEVLAEIARTFPFQNTNKELTRTIGNLDAPRPADGLLIYKLYLSAAPFGTTHELIGLSAKPQPEEAGTAGTAETCQQESGILPYHALADAQIECPRANHWLTLALNYDRVKGKSPNGINWDSRWLYPKPDPAASEGAPAVQILHGYLLGGMGPITCATDPFWNIRVFENALSGHNGYLQSSFICAMNQFVMDDITKPRSDSPVGTPPH